MAKYNHDKPKNHTVPSCGVVFEIGIASSLALHHGVRWLEPWKSIKKKVRCRQDSNLRGETPMDF